MKLIRSATLIEADRPTALVVLADRSGRLAGQPSGIIAVDHRLGQSASAVWQWYQLLHLRWQSNRRHGDFITDLQPADQLNLRNERSSSFDQRRRLVISGVTSAIAGITVAPIFTYGSGHPFNLLLFHASGDTKRIRPSPSAGRNTGRGPPTSPLICVLLRRALGRIRRIDWKGLSKPNLFNRVNFSGVNNVVGMVHVGVSR